APLRVEKTQRFHGPCLRQQNAQLRLSGSADGRLSLGNRADGARKAFLEFDGRLPTEYLASSCDVRLADLRIVDRERLENDLTIRAGDSQHRFRKLEQVELARIAYVYRQMLSAQHEQVE